MTSFRKRLSKKYILADYQKWQGGKWIHWSDQPYLKVNPQGFHMDPAGIYFFPEKFRSEGGWHKKKYKFIVEMPADLKVLDLAKFNTPEAALKLLEDLKVTDNPEWEKFKGYIEEGKHPADSAWEYLQRYFGAAQGLKKAGAFNKRLRQAGYDAVFDDTGSIHSSETQLVILDPRKIKNFKREDVKGTGFELVKDIYDFILGEAKKHGHVSTDSLPIKKQWEGYEQRHLIKSSFKVWSGGTEGSSDRYVYITITARPENKGDTKISTISVTPSHPKPAFNETTPNEVRRGYQQDVRDVKMDDIKSMIIKLFDYVFEGKA